MEDYLKAVFGNNVTLKKLNVSLPLYLKSLYDIYDLYIFDKRLVLMQVKGDCANIANLRKQIAAVENICGTMAVISLDYITPAMRKRLVNEKIQFIVPQKQIFLPYCGIALSEQYPNKTEKPKCFSAKTQLLFAALCYNKELVNYTYAEIAERLNTNNMAISRAVKELDMLGLVSTKSKGTAKSIHPVASGRDLFERGKQYLITPVSKRILVKTDDVRGLCYAGTSALAMQTMLNDDGNIYAVDKSKGKLYKTYPEEYMGDSDISMVELWKYDPMVLSENGVVDFISLYASLQNNGDERIQSALEELEDNHKW